MGKYRVFFIEIKNCVFTQLTTILYAGTFTLRLLHLPKFMLSLQPGSI
jgi:hypothetical protein